MPENPQIANTETSGSVVESLGLPTPHDLSLTPNERVIAVMAQKLDELSREIHEVKKEKILKEAQLPPEILEQLGLPVTPPSRLKRGRGYRPLLAHEIIEAKKKVIEHTGFYNEAMIARYLCVSYFTYKKYAKMYNLWEPKPNLKGQQNFFDAERGKYPLSEILKGKYPDYPVFRIKKKLIKSGIKEAKCELCGFKEKRMIDGKVPLILNFMDGNEKNHLLENMKLYCYNCTFTSGKGYVRSGAHYFDPDWLQDGEKDIITRHFQY